LLSMAKMGLSDYMTTSCYKVFTLVLQKDGDTGFDVANNLLSQRSLEFQVHDDKTEQVASPDTGSDGVCFDVVQHIPKENS
jgi:hypothetical protein